MSRSDTYGADTVRLRTRAHAHDRSERNRSLGLVSSVARAVAHVARSDPRADGAINRTAPAVLVVDHSPDRLNLLTGALRQAGLDPIGVATADAAHDALATEQFGCVVADARMPGMSGVDLLHTLRRRAETSTVPVILMSGSTGADGVLEALEAGADDFLAMTVGVEEIVARVQGHLRTQAAWTQMMVAELRTRARAIQAISQLAISIVPEEAAHAIVAELAARIGCQFVGVYRLVGEYRLEALATWSTAADMRMGGSALAPARANYLVGRAREGPWAERLPGPAMEVLRDGSGDVKLDIAAGAPIYAGDELVGLLTIAIAIDARTAAVPMIRARLLASATDYASVLGAVAGPSIADRRHDDKRKVELRRVLMDSKFFSVYQPIVSIASGRPVGYEALTRFADGTPPDLQFERAAAAGLGHDFELAAIRTAIKSAPTMDGSTFLSLNVSPNLVVSDGRRLRRALARWRGPLVLEFTEHAPIASYAEVRSAVASIRGADLAIDDAGAGYASLRHILELGPAWVKLDISLVHGIDTDPMRQDLVAGLILFGSRSGQRLIAEGVERQEEADTLLGIGVEFAQGNLFGPPRRGRE